jgi:cell division protein FtsX
MKDSKVNMVYLKSLVAGTAAVAIAAALSPIVMAVYFYLVYRTATNEATGWDPTSFVRQPSILAIIALIFVSGFVWEFRRAQCK